MSRIAILGIGAIGSRMAQNLLKEGHEVFVYNRTLERVQPLEAEGAKRASLRGFHRIFVRGNR